MPDELPSNNEPPKEKAKPDLLTFLLNPASKATRTTPLYVPITAGSEPEVRKFIKEEIWSDLKERALWFGVANFVALVGIYFAVQTVAKEAATEEAKQTAHLAVDTVNKSVGDAFTGALNTFVTKLAVLEQQKAKIATGVETDQKELEKLNDSLEAFKKVPTTEVTEFIKALNDDAKELIPKVNKILAGLQGVYRYGVMVIDSDIVAQRLRSQVAVRDNPSSAGSNEVAVGSQDATAGGGLFRIPIDPSQSSPKFDLPEGSEVLASWATTYGGKDTRSYALTRDPFGAPNKFEVLFSSNKNKDEGDIRVYVLYRRPVDTENSK
jgi:hypothetical protein